MFDTAELRSPAWTEHDGQRLVLDPMPALETMQKAADEIERLRKALYQVLTDCEVAGSLSYAARTAHEALGE